VAAWAPWAVADAATLEAVQQKMVKNVSGLRSRAYEERLQELRMDSLAERRVDIDMVQTYKIISGFDKVNSDIWFKMKSYERPT